MTNEITQEEQKEFWEWCGFKVSREGYTTDNGRVFHQTGEDYLYPNRHWGRHWGKRPKLDLNNLFKYAVPKLQKLGYDISVMACPLNFGANISKDKKDIVTTGNDKPEIALFRAIQEVIHAKAQLE